MTDAIETKVARLVGMMQEPERVFRYGDRGEVKGAEFTDDGEWFCFRWAPYIGKKTLAALRRRPEVEAIDDILLGHAARDPTLAHYELFRLRREPADLGDLWLE
jgi:hypothetical protein